MKGEYYQALSAKEFLDKGEIALCIDVQPPLFACFGNGIKLRCEDGFEYWDYEYNGLKRLKDGIPFIPKPTAGEDDECIEL